jgi:hypothetical protein
VSVDVSSLARSRPFRDVRLRVGLLRAEAGVALLVAASFAARLGAAIPHSTPRLFPDEYIYAQLARSLSHGGLTIRGESAHFPALLEPLLAAPAWWFGDVETAFRLTQALHALVASLVAVPVYLLALRLGLAAWQRLACCACALALPALIYSSYLTADAVALTFATTAVYTGLRALDTPTTRTQATFLACAGLSTFARVQYVVLFAAFALAALVVAGGRVHRAVRTYRIAFGVPLVGLGAAVGVGGGALGYYRNVLSLHIGTGLAHWGAVDAMLLVYASGFVLVPGAVVGLALGLRRPQSVTERGFAALTGSLLLLLLSEAAVYAANGSERFQERYLIALLPLVPLLFCVGATRAVSRPTAMSVGALSTVFVLVAARLPLSSYTTTLGSQDSPLLQAVRALQQATSTGAGSLIVALAAAVLAAPAALAFVRPRVAMPAALLVSFVVLAATTVGATITDVRYTRAVAAGLPTDLRWIDHSGARDVSVLVTPATPRPVISAHLFWNQDLTRLLQMRGGDVVDSFGYSKVEVATDGTILVRGRPASGFLLAEEYVNTVTLDGARLVRRDRGASLWHASGPARLRTLTHGRFIDGWLGWPYGTVTVWPRHDGSRTGVLCLPFSLPDVGAPVDLVLTAPGYHRRVTVGPDSSALLAIPRSIRRPWPLHVVAERPFSLGSRLASVVLAPPRFVEGKASAAACR